MTLLSFDLPPLRTDPTPTPLGSLVPFFGNATACYSFLHPPIRHTICAHLPLGGADYRRPQRHVIDCTLHIGNRPLPRRRSLLLRALLPADDQASF